MRSRRLMSIPTVLIITGANEEMCGLQNSSFASVWTPKFGFQIFLFGFGHSKYFRFGFTKAWFISAYSFINYLTSLRLKHGNRKNCRVPVQISSVLKTEC